MENFSRKRSPVRQTQGNKTPPNFSKDEVIQKMMLKKKLKSHISKYNLSSKAPTNDNMCPRHNKLIEVYCITCLEKICTNCALFDNHKVKIS